MWLIAFLAGFSDTFSEGILKRLMGQLGGDQKEDLITQPKFSEFNLLDILQTRPNDKDSTEGKNGESTDKRKNSESHVQVDGTAKQQENTRPTNLNQGKSDTSRPNNIGNVTKSNSAEE
jgi:hypothetical protein